MNADGIQFGAFRPLSGLETPGRQLPPEKRAAVLAVREALIDKGRDRQAHVIAHEHQHAAHLGGLGAHISYGFAQVQVPQVGSDGNVTFSTHAYINSGTTQFSNPGVREHDLTGSLQAQQQILAAATAVGDPSAADQQGASGAAEAIGQIRHLQQKQARAAETLAAQGIYLPKQQLVGTVLNMVG
jgi:hypothetical protein